MFILIKFNYILKGTNETNEILLKKITEDGKIYMVPSKVNGRFFIRFAVCAATTEKSHIDYAWKVIVDTSNSLLSTT